MVLFPNAKINIGLNIVERRADGYHNIETVMCPVKWCDILEIVPAQGNETTLTTTGRAVNCPPEKNLVMKAYRLFQQETGIGNVDIYLHKIIPDGAGLGGGSADAAFTLIGLNENIECNLSKDQLAGMAAKIGADCPFFIYNEPQLATGIGTEFTPVEVSLDDYSILIVKPQVSVPTAQAYAGVTPMQADHNLATAINLPISQWNGIIKNDFEKSVFPALPEIEIVKQKIIDMGADYVSMSGSGSAVYGIFSKNDILSAEIKALFPQCDIFYNKF